MGCASSMKVVPTVEQNGTDKKHVANGNNIRTDRVSLADARARREEESRNRLRRISSLQPEEVDRVRRNSSRNSSHGSSRAANSFNPLREEVDKSDDEDVTKQKKKKKKKKKSKENIPPNISHVIVKKDNLSEPDSSDIEASLSDQPSRSKSAIKTKLKKNQNIDEDVQDLVVPFQTIVTNSSEENEIHTSSIQNKNEYDSQQRTSHYRSEGDGKTDSPFAVHSDDNNIDSRQSMDSLKLKADADLFVNSIVTQALQRIENDKQQETDKKEHFRRENLPFKNEEKSEKDSISMNSTIVDEHAKGLVGNVLSNALFIVSTDNNK